MIGKTFEILRFVVFLFVVMSEMSVFASQDVKISGFISQGYMKSNYNNFLTDSEDGSFQFNEMGINFVNQLNPRFQIGLQFFARDLGDLGNDKITLDWAHGDFYIFDWLGIRAGKLKIPTAFYSESRDYDILRTCIILPQGIYQEGRRDALSTLKGMEIYGSLPNSYIGNFFYRVQYGIVNIEPDDGFAKDLNSRGGGMDYDRIDVESLYVIRLDYEPSKLLRGFNVYCTVGDFSINSYATFAGDDIEVSIEDAFYYFYGFEYSWESLVIFSELYHCNADVVITSLNTGLPFFPQAKAPIDGGYIGLTYRFLSWLEIGGYYTYYYPNSEDKKGKDKSITYFASSNAWFKDTCLSVRFDINENWIFKIESHFIDGTAVMFAIDQDDPENVEEEYMVFAAKLSFMF